MRVSVATREITCKVVYYGPGMSGKTTNLRIIHDRAPRQAVGELLTLDTHSERTLHFDLLPLDLGRVRGYAVRFEFFTVPGQSYYAATRRLVLEGADGVVFVADSRREALDENIDSMNDLLDNLRHHQLPEDLPVVIQYNKQDLPTALKPEQLDPLLNIRRWTRFTGVATNGDGVLETMKAIAEQVILRASQNNTLPAQVGTPPAEPQPQNRTWLITCFRCQNMLETVNARPGSLFTCGACGTALEVVNIEHGLTRAPALAASSTQQLLSGNTAPSSGTDDTGYGLQSLAPDNSGAALGAPPSGEHPLVGDPQAGNVPFELDGFDQITILDDTVQGRRYRIRERSTGNRYRALVVSPTLARQPGYLTQVEPYARLASQIRHPHILQLASLRQGRETPILLSNDPPDHESLSHVLARRRTLAPPHALGVIRQLALALEEASRAGVVHGWIRPDVVLLSSEGNVLLDELGLPKNHRFLVRELNGASAATEYYLAPEHLSEETRSDARSDIFLLAALLFRMVTGEGMVTGFNAHEALHKVIANGAKGLRSVQPGISRDLDTFFQRMTATERKDRYQSYRELIDVLDRFGGGAKRATLRLTQGPAGASQGGTSRVTRPVSRGPGSGIRRSAGGPGTASFPRSGGSVDSNYAPERRRESESHAFTWAVVGIVLLALGLAAFLVLQQSSTVQPQSSADTGSGEPPVMTPDTSPQQTPPPPALPAQTPPATNIATRGPAPAPATQTGNPPAPANTGGAEDPAKTEILYQIAQLERQQHYQEAFLACSRLPDPNDQDARRNDVLADHQTMRNQVEAAVGQAKSFTKAKSILQPALTTWGMEGDVEWAQDLMAKARAQLPVSVPGETRVDNVTPGAATTIPTATNHGEAVPPSPSIVPADSQNVLAAKALAKVEDALRHDLPGLVDSAVSSLDAASPQAVAIKTAVALWNTRTSDLSQVIHSRKPVLRLTPPAESQAWDVTDAAADGVQVTSPAGSGTRIDWAHVNPQELGRLYQTAANDPKATPDEHALAAVMLLLGNDTALAGVELVRHRAQMTPATADAIATLIALHRQLAEVEILSKAQAAMDTDDLAGLDAAIASLKQPGLINNPETTAILPKLEAASTRLHSGKPADGSPAKDDLRFATASDVLSFPLRHGGWRVTPSGLTCDGGRGDLVRRDLINAKSVNLIFQIKDAKGGLTINFRGVRLIIDFAQRRIQASSRIKDIAPDTFSFIPSIAQSVFIEQRPHSNLVSIEINNGVKIYDVPNDVPTNDLEIGVDTGASITFSEIAIARETATASGPASPAVQQADIRQLGFEPIGATYLDHGSIILPASTGAPSGLALAVRNSIASVTYLVKGTGKVRFQLGRPNFAGGVYFELDLPPVPTKVSTFNVSWTNGIFSVKDGDGLILGEQKIPNLANDLMLLALGQATLVTPPRINHL